MRTAKVKKWAEFQHYKNRCPPWIKLQKSILDDFDFACLPIASKALAPLLWLLASESTDGDVRIDPDWLAFRLRFSVDDVRAGLTPLIEKGFLIVASEVLAECLQDACLEGEGEGETEGEEREAIASLSPSGDAPDCPHGEIVAMYHDLLPANPRIKVWDGDRAKALRTRWREDAKRQDLDYWRRFFAHVAASPFLTGQVEDRNGRPFLPGLDWLVKASNFAKVIEGRYHDRRAA